MKEVEMKNNENRRNVDETKVESGDVTITDTKYDGDMLDIYLTSYWEYFGDEKYNYAHAKFKENPDSIYGYSIVSYVKTDEYGNDIISSSNGDDFASDIVKNSVSNATGQSRLVMTKDEITKEEGRIRESVNSGTAKKRIS